MTKKAQSLKKSLPLALVLAIFAFGCGKKTGDKDQAGAKKTYNAMMYIAGMGGHFSAADITIDPNNTKQPIKIKNLGRVDIGSKKTHPTHDPRIDANNRNLMFWSTYKLDGKNYKTGKLHVGKTNLKTGKVIKDVAYAIPKESTWSGANYCASGQSKKYFLPVSMANAGYIDVIDKKSLKLKHRVFMDKLGYKPGTYTFSHGTNTPDLKKFVLTMNVTPSGHLKFTGKTVFIVLDMAALEKGRIKKISETSVTGKAGVPGTLTFRQYFSKDGKLFFQSGADRGFIFDFDGTKLTLKKEITDIDGENHDIMPTPDAKYAILTLRKPIKNAKGKKIQDGTLQLYDIEAQEVIGKSVSVCYACHKEADVEGSAALCGIDGNFK